MDIVQFGFHFPARFFLHMPDVFSGGKAAFSGHGVNKPFLFQFIIGALGGDDADAQVAGQCADGRENISLVQLSGENQRFNLGVDLVVNRLTGRRTDQNFRGRASFLFITVYEQYTQFCGAVKYRSISFYENLCYTVQKREGADPA